MKKSLFLFAAAVWLTALGAYSQDAKTPVRFAMVGLNHDHAMSFIPRLAGRTDVQLVGIVETNQDLIARYSGRFHLNPKLFYPSLEALFAKTNVQAVATFTSTFDHEGVVEICAAHGVDVMMEKPLATNMKQARAIEAAAKKSGIQVIVNYETSYYPGNLGNIFDGSRRTPNRRHSQNCRPRRPSRTEGNRLFNQFSRVAD